MMLNTAEVCREFLEDKKSIFSVLNPEQKDILKSGLTAAFYKKGDFIFKEGDKPTGLICLSEGKVKVFKEGVGGREQIVRLAKPIGFIGYRALFAEQNHHASAVAIEDSTVCSVDKDTLYKLIRSNTDLSLSIIKAFATELGFSYFRTVTLTQKHIRGRLAESVLFLKDTYGFEKDEKTLKVYLSREDIANLSNMTTSNAIRTLSAFANEGVIAIDGRKIKILDVGKLERISELG
ncbi:MAG TPA: Crp/Fnr family transcriptional regulator [Bacteroidales bacterium]|nr:Crp/Fnr family transcriptional regulator [Bacteroidales bacterium]